MTKARLKSKMDTKEDMTISGLERAKPTASQERVAENVIKQNKKPGSIETKCLLDLATKKRGKRTRRPRQAATREIKMSIKKILSWRS